MYRKKIYGMSREDICMFCDKRAIAKNKQGLLVCLFHKDSVLEEKRCVCGELFEIKHSKWGAFFLCKNCGPKSIDKGLEKNSGYKLNKKYRKEEKIYTLDELEKLWQ